MNVPNRHPDIHRKFVLTALDSNKNKWWDVEFWEAEKISRTTFGRNGQGCAQPSVKVCSSQSALETLIRTKTKKGYKELKTASQVVNIKCDGIDDSIVKRINTILKVSNESIKSFLSISLDSLSSEQILEGKDALSYVVSLKDKSVDSLIKAAQAYYNTIPTKLPAKINPEAVAKKLLENAADEEERLDQLLAALTANKVAIDGGDLFDQIGAKFELSTDKEFSEIENWILNTRSNKHYGYDKLKLKELYKVTIPNERKTFESCQIGNLKTLFHGTNEIYVSKILKSGLIIPKYAANGSMYGRGIYLADVSTKSLNYCRGNEKYMFLVDTKLGKQYTTRTTGSWTEAPKGCDSVFAPNGEQKGAYSGYLNFNEYIVYKPEQQTIKYICVL